MRARAILLMSHCGRHLKYLARMVNFFVFFLFFCFVHIETEPQMFYANYCIEISNANVLKVTFRLLLFDIWLAKAFLVFFSSAILMSH